MAAPPVERSLSVPMLRCRMCDAGGLQAVLTLAPTPPGDSLVAQADLSAQLPCLPLTLNRCAACGHVQLADLVDRIHILGRPVTAIGANPRRRQASEALALHLIDRLAPSRDSLVVGIGSNDGTILKPFEDAGCRVQGIEPAANVAGAAIAAGIPTHPGLFSPAIAEKIEEERGRAALILAGPAFAEAGDPVAWMEGVRLLLRRDGVFGFCVDGLADLIENARIDRITHRTIDYHAIAPLKRFLAASDLQLFAAERRPSGALFGLAQRFGGRHPPEASLDALIEAERAAGIASDAAFGGLAARLAAARAATAALIKDARRDGVRVAGLGAGGGATTLLHQLGSAAADLDFLADDAPHRQGRFSPGLQIAVRPLSAIDAERPGLVLLLDPDEADVMAERFAAQLGLRLVQPLSTAAHPQPARR